MTSSFEHTTHPPQPIVEVNQDHLPSALTFFLTKAQRTQILRALKAIDPDRTAALMHVLTTTHGCNEGGH